MYKRFGLSDLHPLHMIHRLWYQPPCSTLQTKSATRFGFAAILVNDCFESQNFWYISNFFWCGCQKSCGIDIESRTIFHSERKIAYGAFFRDSRWIHTELAICDQKIPVNAHPVTSHNFFSVLKEVASNKCNDRHMWQVQSDIPTNKHS